MHIERFFYFKLRGCKIEVVDYDAVFYSLLVIYELAKKEVNFD